MVQVRVELYLCLFFLTSISFCAQEAYLSLPRLLEGPVRVLSSLDIGFEDALLRPLKETQDGIMALQYALTNKPVLATLQARASAGVPVELVLDPSTLATMRCHERGAFVVVEETRGLNKGVRDLICHEGVDVRVYDGSSRGLMHCKTFIMRGVNTGQGKVDVVHSGSANCSGAGMDGTNCEISHLFTDEDVVEEYAGIYERVKASSRRVVFGEAGMKKPPLVRKREFREEAGGATEYVSKRKPKRRRAKVAVSITPKAPAAKVALRKMLQQKKFTVNISGMGKEEKRLTVASRLPKKKKKKPFAKIVYGNG